jgi:hypothetical protein
MHFKKGYRAGELMGKCENCGFTNQIDELEEKIIDLKDWIRAASVSLDWIAENTKQPDILEYAKGNSEILKEQAR